MSEEKQSLFKKIDSAIFRQIDGLRTDPSYNKISDFLNNFSEQESRIIQQVLTFLFLLVPFFFVLILFFSNYQTKKELSLKKQVIEEFDVLNSNRENLMATGPQFLAPSSIQSQSDIESRVRNILSSNAIDQSKISIKNFDVALSTTTFTKTFSTINFNKFGTNDFNLFLKNLVEFEKFKISKIKMSRDMELELLQGEIELLHLGRNSSEGF